eukprot:gene10171-8076_t
MEATPAKVDFMYPLDVGGLTEMEAAPAKVDFMYPLDVGGLTEMEAAPAKVDFMYPLDVGGLTEMEAAPAKVDFMYPLDVGGLTEMEAAPAKVDFMYPLDVGGLTEMEAAPAKGTSMLNIHTLAHPAMGSNILLDHVLVVPYNTPNALLLGTSMSTPGIAGAAAIIRQYFMHGFLNNGTCGMTDGMEPSGMLLRGVLVAGAVSLNGYSMATAYPILPAPSSHQGFGRVDLSRSLPLAGDAKGWKLQVHDMVPIDSQMEFTYEVECTGGGPLIVVLSWYDYWSFGGVGGKLLINDLDVASLAATFASNGLQGRHTVTTVPGWAVSLPGPERKSHRRKQIEEAWREVSLALPISPMAADQVAESVPPHPVRPPPAPAMTIRSFGWCGKLRLINDLIWGKFTWSATVRNQI